jgi:hypothetical protein
MLFGGTVAGKCLIEHFKFRYFIYVEHAPVGKASGAALASRLIRKQSALSILHAVVVRLGDSWFALIGEGDLVAAVDRVHELIMNLRTRVADYQPGAVVRIGIIRRHQSFDAWRLVVDTSKPHLSHTKRDKDGPPGLSEDISIQEVVSKFSRWIILFRQIDEVRHF